MEPRQGTKSSADMLPVLTFVTRRCSDQPNNAKPKPTATTIQHLNDDCLLQIFAVKSLELADLCSLAETCLRFQKISQRVFPKELQIYIGHDRVYNVAARDCLHIGDPLCNVERIMQNFGDVVEGISFSTLTSTSTATSNYLLNLVATYCADTLRSLMLDDMAFADSSAVGLELIFGRLEVLHICFGSVERGQRLFAKCNSLMELRVYAVKNSDSILENTFPKLERFSYQEQHINKLDERLSNFISRHSTLRALDLNSRTDEMLLHVINKSCKKLEKLCLSVGHRNASDLASLQPLKSLRALMVRTCTDFRFVPVLTELRELQLNNYSLPKDSTQFGFLTQITKLIILQTYTPGSFDVVVAVIRRLRHLLELTVGDEPWNGFQLDEKMYYEIVDIVNGRRNVLTLKCKFDFILKCSNENRKVNLLQLDDRLFSF